MITSADGALARRPTWDEVEAVRTKACELGLDVIE
jgi:hypothetical protein